MKNIVSRQYQILKDHMAVYDFMVEIYERDWRNGVPAPFLEYALMSTWMDSSYSYLNRIWEDGDKIVGFVFHENPVTDIFFSLRPGYEEIADEMIKYAGKNMPNFDNKRQFMLFRSQEALIAAAKRAGYSKVYEYENLIISFEHSLDYSLPEGYHFVNPKDIDLVLLSQCTWKGFDHEVDGPWKDESDQYVIGTVTSPGNQLKGNLRLTTAPHLTPEYNVVIANEEGEYVCFAGMWWVPENHLAYMEPLCTIPEYRNKGLAAAALSEMYRRMKPLGATHMTGGDNEFYKKIGYGDGKVAFTMWKNE